MQENIPYLYVVRENIARHGYQPFDPTTATQVVQDFTDPWRQKEIESIMGDSPEVLEWLCDIDTDTAMIEPDQRPAALSAHYVMEITRAYFWLNAIKAQEKQDPGQFIYFFDTNFGALMGIIPILDVTTTGIAESDRATLISDVAEFRRLFFKPFTNIADQAETYLSQEAEKRKWTVLFNETTDEAGSKIPKGFILIDERAKQLKGLQNRLGVFNEPEGLVPQFVASGADFSNTLFRAIYPVAEQFIRLK